MMEEPGRIPLRIKGWNRFFWVMIIWIIGWLGIIAKQAVAQYDPLDGAWEGAQVGSVTSPFMLLLTVPLGCLGWKIASRWALLGRHRLALSLLLPTLFSFLGTFEMAYNRAFPQRKFERFTGVRFPFGAKVDGAWYNGMSAPLGDASCVFELTCTSEETERLIQELGLRKDHGVFSTSSRRKPTVGTWKVESIWRANFLEERPKRHADYVELETDESRTRIRLVAGTI